MYSVTGIVLKILIPREKYEGFRVLTREHGVIDIYLKRTKKDPFLDIWSVIWTRIDCEHTVNKARWWHVRSQMTLEHLAYTPAVSVLTCLALIHDIIKPGQYSEELFDDVLHFLSRISEQSDSIPQHTALMTLRILKRTGMGIPASSTPIIERLYAWIDRETMERTLSLKGLSDGDVLAIHSHCSRSITQYTSGV